MGRRKRNRHLWQMTKQKKSLQVVKTMEEEEEDAFYLLVDEGGFTLPYQFRNWKAHFKTRASFLEKAARWLKGEYDGMPKRVITDVECGRESYNALMIKNGQVSPESRRLYDGEHNPAEHIEEDWSGYENDDFQWSNAPVKKKWSQGVGYRYMGSHYQGYLFNKELPLKPEIEAPSGQSGKNLVVL